MKLVFIVNDDDAINSVLAQALPQQTLYQILYISDGSTLLRFARHVKPDLIIVGYETSISNGIRLHDQLRLLHEFRKIPLLIISSDLPLNACMKEKIIRLRTPLDLNDFLKMIEQALAR